MSTHWRARFDGPAMAIPVTPEEGDAYAALAKSVVFYLRNLTKAVRSQQQSFSDRLKRIQDSMSNCEANDRYRDEAEDDRIAGLEKAVERLNMQRDTLNLNQEAMSEEVRRFVALSPDDKKVQRVLGRAEDAMVKARRNSEGLDALRAEAESTESRRGEAFDHIFARLDMLEEHNAKLRKKVRKLKRGAT